MSGWQTVLHYGSLIGEYSLLTLLPELRLGVFTSYNGAVQTDPFTVSSLLHVHLIDLFIGVRPSVDNVSHWCGPPFTSGQLRRQNELESAAAAGSLRYAIAAYVGVYWHAVLGEFEVWDDGTATLMARYGSVEVRLQPWQSGLEFTGVPTDCAWSMLLDSVYVEFSSLNGDRRRCRDVTVQLLTFDTFQRRDEADLHAAVTTSAAATIMSAHATTVTIIPLLLTDH